MSRPRRPPTPHAARPARARAGVVLGALAVALSWLFTAGCGPDVVCIQWSQKDGACPSRQDARKFMAPPCDEPIVSIDSDGELDDGACCYEVTKRKQSYCAIE